MAVVPEGVPVCMTCVTTEFNRVTLVPLYYIQDWKNLAQNFGLPPGIVKILVCMYEGVGILNYLEISKELMCLGNVLKF
jgi:hypothetical protein